MCIPIRNPKTLRKWYTSFRTFRMFRVRLIDNKLNGITKLPPMLDKYPELVQQINTYMSSNIGDISVQQIHQHIEKCLHIIFKESFVDLTQEDDSSIETNSDCESVLEEGRIFDEMNSDNDIESTAETDTDGEVASIKSRDSVLMDTLQSQVGFNVKVKDYVTYANLIKPEPKDAEPTPQENIVIDLTVELVKFERKSLSEKKTVLRRFRRKLHISHRTAHRWMRALGYTYCSRRKIF